MRRKYLCFRHTRLVIKKISPGQPQQNFFEKKIELMSTVTFFIDFLIRYTKFYCERYRRKNIFVCSWCARKSYISFDLLDAKFWKWYRTFDMNYSTIIEVFNSTGSLDLYNFFLQSSNCWSYCSSRKRDICCFESTREGMDFLIFLILFCLFFPNFSIFLRIDVYFFIEFS